MDAVFKRRVRDVLHKQELYHLIPLYDSVYNVPQRVNEYNADLFTVFNPKSQYFEIHSLEHDGNLPSLQCALPYKNLDARTERYIRQNDIRVRGQEIFREIERDEQLKEKRQERERRNMVRDIASETQSMFAKDAWTFGT